MQRKVNEIRNNIFDTNEILWLLEGNEDMPALEFVCRYILEVEPENISDVFENNDLGGGAGNVCSGGLYK